MTWATIPAVLAGAFAFFVVYAGVYEDDYDYPYDAAWKGWAVVIGSAALLSIVVLVFFSALLFGAGSITNRASAPEPESG